MDSVKLSFQDVALAVTDLTVAATTLVSGAALAALTVFKTIGLPATVTKAAALLGGAVLLSHPIGYGILLTGIVIGGIVYIGYRIHQAYKEHKAEAESQERLLNCENNVRETRETMGYLNLNRSGNQTPSIFASNGHLDEGI